MFVLLACRCVWYNQQSPKIFSFGFQGLTIYINTQASELTQLKFSYSILNKKKPIKSQLDTPAKNIVAGSVWFSE